MATPITPVHMDGNAADYLNELASLNAELEPLQARKAELEKYLRGLTPGKYTNGVFDLTVSPSKRFNKKKFSEAFPFEKFPHLYKQPAPEPDTRAIAPSVKNHFSDEYDARLTIK